MVTQGVEASSRAREWAIFLVSAGMLGLVIYAAGFLLAAGELGGIAQQGEESAARYGLSQEVSCDWEATRVEEVRVLLPNEWGVPYPVGLSYSWSRDQLILMGQPGEQPDERRSTLVVITPYEELVGEIDVPFQFSNAINITTDDTGNELLLLDDVRMEITRVWVGQDGVSPVNRPVIVDVGGLGLLQVAGMAVEADTRRLLIVDSEALQIVGVDIEQNFELTSRIDLGHLEGEALRGIAVHPGNGHFFVGGATENVLYELAETGAVVNCYDLAGLELVGLQGMGFGPSADMTDRPDTIHLFIAESNRGGNERDDSQRVFGSIREVAIYSRSSYDCTANTRHSPRRR